MDEDGAVHAHESLAVSLEISADELPRSSFQHLENFAGGTEIGSAGVAGDADENLVPGGGIEGVLFTDENLRSGLALDHVRPNEAGPRGRLPIDAGDGTVGRRGADRVILANDEPALLDQLAQSPAEGTVIFGG